MPPSPLGMLYLLVTEMILVISMQVFFINEILVYAIVRKNGNLIHRVHFF